MFNQENKHLYLLDEGPSFNPICSFSSIKILLAPYSFSNTFSFLLFAFISWIAHCFTPCLFILFSTNHHHLPSFGFCIAVSSLPFCLFIFVLISSSFAPFSLLNTPSLFLSFSPIISLLFSSLLHRDCCHPFLQMFNATNIFHFNCSSPKPPLSVFRQNSSFSFNVLNLPSLPSLPVFICGSTNRWAAVSLKKITCDGARMKPRRQRKFYFFF